VYSSGRNDGGKGQFGGMFSLSDALTPPKTLVTALSLACQNLLHQALMVQV